LPRLPEAIAAILAWAKSRPDIAGLALVGSHARGAARPQSDVDFLLLTATPDAFRADWLAEIAWPEPPTASRDAQYGIVWSRHVAFATLPEAELAFAPLAWAALPLDPGTRRVVSDGFLVLHDPAGHFAKIRAALEPDGSAG